jgi:Dullard-like phosphatase family protein
MLSDQYHHTKRLDVLASQRRGSLAILEKIHWSSPRMKVKNPSIVKLPREPQKKSLTRSKNLLLEQKSVPQLNIRLSKGRKVSNKPLLSMESKLENSSFKTKTLVLDLDETLVKVTNGEFFDVVLPGIPALFVMIRPYLKELLEYASQVFKIVIFTASSKSYADRILNFLDPTNSYFSARFYRDDCCKTIKGFVKDLEILHADLAKVIFVDDQMVSFERQPFNGVKISPWHGEKEDSELRNLISFLRMAERSEDVRVNIQALKMNF